MTYSIKEIAELAGVTTRTLRFYDEIGLLNPAGTASNGYRFYDQESLYHLQQILFFRELEVPLDEIRLIMTSPDFDLLVALEKHRKFLEIKSKRLSQLINTIENTIATIKGKMKMDDKAMFEGFDETKYEEETRQHWGKTPQYQESQKKWASFSKEQKDAIKVEGRQIAVRMVGKNANLSPDDPDVQKAIGDYLIYINQYFYKCDPEFLRNLSDMWVADARFAINYERIREGGAEFVREAVTIFCDKQKHIKV
jgi:DNA-binding transcriptional MerR regulator